MGHIRKVVNLILVLTVVTFFGLIGAAGFAPTELRQMSPVKSKGNFTGMASDMAPGLVDGLLVEQIIGHISVTPSWLADEDREAFDEMMDPLKRGDMASFNANRGIVEINAQQKGKSFNDLLGTIVYELLGPNDQAGKLKAVLVSAFLWSVALLLLIWNMYNYWFNPFSFGGDLKESLRSAAIKTGVTAVLLVISWPLFIVGLLFTLPHAGVFYTCLEAGVILANLAILLWGLSFVVVPGMMPSIGAFRPQKKVIKGGGKVKKPKKVDFEQTTSAFDPLTLDDLGDDD